MIVPLRQQGELIGTLTARRTEVRPFTPAQIKLLETFADQAVIAIENVRLFQELKESLEQQTATSEILGVIASSPTDIQPVLDAVAENAARLCERRRCVRSGASKANVLRLRGSLWSDPHQTREARPITRIRQLAGRCSTGKRFMFTTCCSSAERVSRKLDAISVDGIVRCLPCRCCARTSPSARSSFGEPKSAHSSDNQIKLLETFADQAVIAIENVRLFQELQTEVRGLEQQTATSEILGVIASSPTDIQPVLDVVAENAARLCDASDALIRSDDGDNSRACGSLWTACQHRSRGQHQ